MDDFDLYDVFDDAVDESLSRIAPKMSFEEYVNSLSDTSFYEAYRMSKECFNIIFRQLKFKKKVRGNYLDGEFELLTLLRYLSTGSFMLISGNLLNISKSTAHKFIHRSIKVICESATAWIKFPCFYLYITG